MSPLLVVTAIAAVAVDAFLIFRAVRRLKKRREPLTHTARIALEGSIKKWNAILNDSGADWGDDNCPLCLLFLCGDCIGCPVRAETGKPYCQDSPFEEWVGHFQTAHSGIYDLDGAPLRVQAGCAECRRIAAKELAFLKSLENRK